MIPTILALRIVTTAIALGMLVAFFTSPKPHEKWAMWQARGWAFMCAAVLVFGTQFFILEQFGLPIRHPARQWSIGLAMLLMWPAFQCARASALYQGGANDRAVRADQIVSWSVGAALIAVCNLLAALIW